MADAPAALGTGESAGRSDDDRRLPLTAKLLDAEILDDFLIRLLLHSFLADLKALHHHPTRFQTWLRRTAADPSGLLQPLARAATLLLCRGQTPAVRLLGLRVRVRQRRRPWGAAPDAAGPEPPLPWPRVGAYAVIAIVLPTVYERLKQHWNQHRSRRLQTIMERRIELEERHRVESPPNHGGGLDDPGVNESDAPDSAPIRLFNSQCHPQIKALERRERLGSLLLRLMDRLIPTVQVAALLGCWAGLSSTPSAAMLLAGLRYDDAPSTSTPPARLAVDYAYRRWLYRELAQTARLLWAGLALTGTWRPLLTDTWREWRPRLLWVWRRWQWLPRLRGAALAHGSDGLVPEGRTKALQSPECLLCHTNPIVIPVEADCPCRGVYCYTCLYQYSRRNARRRASDATQTPCVKCGGSIKKASFSPSGADSSGKNTSSVS